MPLIRPVASSLMKYLGASRCELLGRVCDAYANHRLHVKLGDSQAVRNRS